MPLRFSAALKRGSIYGALIGLALFYLGPLIVMLMTSFKGPMDLRTGQLISLPQELVLDAWRIAWTEACTGVECTGVKGYFFNSVGLVIPAVAISTFVGAINGYALSFFRFRGSELFFGCLLFGCFVPFQAILIPMAQTLGFLGLAQSLGGLIFVHCVYGIAFTTMFFRNYFQSVPMNLIQAARIDGAGFSRIFLRIILPLSVPMIVVSVIWQFTQVWNDFLFGVVFAGKDNQPVTVALNNMVNTSTGIKQYNVDMAGAVIAALPTLLIYVLAGRFFVKGLMAGAVKG